MKLSLDILQLPTRGRESTGVLERDRCFPDATKAQRTETTFLVLRWPPVRYRSAALWALACGNDQGEFILGFGTLEAGEDADFGLWARLYTIGIFDARILTQLATIFGIPSTILLQSAGKMLESRR